MATIQETIRDIDSLDREDVVFAKPEWRPDSEAAVFRLTKEFRAPPEATEQGFQYFLEVDLIRQILDDLSDAPDVPLAAKVERVIHYALFDA